MKFSIKDFFGKCDQIRMKLQIWSHLPKKSLMENFILCAVREQWKLWLTVSVQKLFVLVALALTTFINFNY